MLYLRPGSAVSRSGKALFLRGPPVAAERLAELGVDAVTLANNHALDYGADALLDTLRLLEAAGVGTVGAGEGEELARAPLRLRRGELALRLVAFCDHPGRLPRDRIDRAWRSPISDPGFRLG